MPTREEIAYFGAGPAPLPTPVLEAGAKAFLNYEDTGLGLAEISHRSPTATKILTDTKASLTSLLDIPDNYDILFMHGGGSGGFSSTVHNLVAVWVEQRRREAEKELGDDTEKVLERVRRQVREELRLDYLVTGSWSLKASQEAARLLGPLGSDLVNVALDSRKANGGRFGTIPDEATWELTPTRRQGGKGAAFVYYCDNETVDGVEFPGVPEVLQDEERLVVADMSSNFISRRVDISKFAVIFVRHRYPHSPAPLPLPKLTVTVHNPGRRAKKHRPNRPNPRHHPQRPPHHPPTPHLPTRRRRLVAPHRLRLPYHRQKRLSLQHAAHLQRLDRGRSDAAHPGDLRVR